MIQNQNGTAIVSLESRFPNLERKFVNFGKIIDHETSPSNPTHVAVADKVHYKKPC
jgi:hypothetical protein